MQPRHDPVEWANKKKAAIERAKLLKEQRKKEKETSENCTFQPSVNKRPSFLDKQANDSLDTLANDYHAQTTNVFEQPLRGINPSILPPSPGSDTLGREMKRHNSNDLNPMNQQPRGSSLREYIHRDNTQQTPKNPSKTTPLPAVEHPVEDEAFFSMLRSDVHSSPTDKPAWNTDCDPPPDFDSLLRKKERRRQNKTKSSNKSFSRPVVERSNAASTSRRPQWNDDITPPAVPIDDYTDPDPCIPARSTKSVVKEASSSSGNRLRTSQSGGSVRNGSSRTKLSSSIRDFPQQQQQYQQQQYQQQQHQYQQQQQVNINRPISSVKRTQQQQQSSLKNTTYYQQSYDERDQICQFNGVNSSGFPPEIQEYEYVDAGEQNECPDCGRRFNPSAFQKHVKICAKVFLQKRKKFDSTKMRVQDNPELVQLLRKTKKEGKNKPNNRSIASRPQEMSTADSKKAKWQAESNAFRDAMRAAREATKAMAEGKPLPPPVPSAPDPSLVPCPHCGRTYNEKAAERHIPQCKNIRAKPSVLRRGTGGGGGMNGALAAKKKSQGRREYGRKLKNISNTKTHDTYMDQLEAATSQYRERDDKPAWNNDIDETKDFDTLMREKERERRRGKPAKGKFTATMDTRVRHEDQVVGGRGKMSNWRAESAAFRDAMKQAKRWAKEQKAKEEQRAREFPVNEVAFGSKPTFSACPHCSKRVNVKGFEKHYRQCQYSREKQVRTIRNKMGSSSVKKNGF